MASNKHAEAAAGRLATALHEVIRSRLGVQDVSATALAHQIGRSVDYVTDRLKRDMKALDVNDVANIADVLGVSVLELFTAAAELMSRGDNGVPTAVEKMIKDSHDGRRSPTVRASRSKRGKPSGG